MQCNYYVAKTASKSHIYKLNSQRLFFVMFCSVNNSYTTDRRLFWALKQPIAVTVIVIAQTAPNMILITTTATTIDDIDDEDGGGGGDGGCERLPTVLIFV